MLRRLPRNWLLVLGLVVTLSGMVVARFATDVSYVVDNRVNQRFLTMLADNDLIRFSWRGAIEWQDYTPDQLALQVATRDGALILHHRLTAEEKARIEGLPAQFPDDNLRMVQSKNGLWISGWGSESLFNLASTFDANASPVRLGVIYRVLAFEARHGYMWSLDYASNHGPAFVPFEFLGMLPQLAVVPVMAVPFVRLLLSYQLLTAIGVAMVIAYAVRARSGLQATGPR